MTTEGGTGMTQETNIVRLERQANPITPTQFDEALAIVERARMVRPTGLRFDYKQPKEEE